METLSNNLTDRVRSNHEHDRVARVLLSTWYQSKLSPIGDRYVVVMYVVVETWRLGSLRRVETQVKHALSRSYQLPWHLKVNLQRATWFGHWVAMFRRMVENKTRRHPWLWIEWSDD